MQEKYYIVCIYTQSIVREVSSELYKLNCSCMPLLMNRSGSLCMCSRKNTAGAIQVTATEVEPLAIALTPSGTEGTESRIVHGERILRQWEQLLLYTQLTITQSLHSLLPQCESSPSAVCTLSRSLNGPKATVKALTEKLYWVPGTRSDSTIVVVLPVVFTTMSPAEDDCCSS